MKLHIDFSIRETDVPEEEARGVRFGEDIDAKQVFDFFNKCRDAVMTLFGQRVPKDRFEYEREELEKKINKLKDDLLKQEILRQKEREHRPAIDPGRPHCPPDGDPWKYRPDPRKHCDPF